MRCDLLLELFLAVTVLLTDQLSKFFVSATVPYAQSKEIIRGVFALTNVRNYGAAWGMFSGARVFFICFTIFILVLICVFLKNKRNDLSIPARILLVLIASGAAGNLIDRIFYSYVRDMFDFYCIGFPVFNVADMAVTAGAALLIVDTLLGGKGSVYAVAESELHARRKKKEAE